MPGRHSLLFSAKDKHTSFPCQEETEVLQFVIWHFVLYKIRVHRKKTINVWTNLSIYLLIFSIFACYHYRCYLLIKLYFAMSVICHIFLNSPFNSMGFTHWWQQVWRVDESMSENLPLQPPASLVFLPASGWQRHCRFDKGSIECRRLTSWGHHWHPVNSAAISVWRQRQTIEKSRTSITTTLMSLLDGCDINKSHDIFFPSENLSYIWCHQDPLWLWWIWSC